jgi:hypothetical protein
VWRGRAIPASRGPGDPGVEGNEEDAWPRCSMPPVTP